MTASDNGNSRWPVFATIAWVSLTLLLAGGADERMSAQTRTFWMWAGQAGLISAIGLFELHLRRARASRAVLEGESRTDPLTGLANRRRFDEELERRWHEWLRKGRQVCLLLIDVDHFKQLNDDHGHLVGDRVLAELGHVLADEVRGTDLAARYGGEEFGVLAVATGSEGAVQAAERMRRRIAGHPFCGGKQPTRRSDDQPAITVSIGVAQFEHTDESPRQLVRRADDALYAAKRAGRNQVSTVVGQSDRVILAGTLPEELAENIALADAVVGQH